jgi:hypothetical protein
MINARKISIGKIARSFATAGFNVLHNINIACTGFAV